MRISHSASLLAVSLAKSLAASDAVIDVGYSKFRGLRNETTGVTTYYGIKYAASPAGERRWQPPVPVDDETVYDTEKVIDATKPGNICFQFEPLWQELLAGTALSAFVAGPSSRPMDEDCLLLDIYVPNTPRSNRLPVIVQIHGGGYTLGDSTGSDGSPFTAYAKGQIIYIQIQYRLGSFGFLGNEAVRSEGTANAGLLDQRAALNWIQRHITKFGGDPKKVTIWGGSAGGGSVASQIIMHGGSSEPPFRAAIAEYPWVQTLKDDQTLENQYQSLLQATNCSNLKCLRSIDQVTLGNATILAANSDYMDGMYGYGDYYYGPTVDGDIIRALPSHEFSRGHFSHVALLTDREAYEAFPFTNFSTMREDQVRLDLAQVWSAANETFFDGLFDVYNITQFTGLFFDQAILDAYATLFNTTIHNSPFYQRVAAYSDYIINCPTWQMSSSMSSAGLPVYKMRFNAGYQAHAATTPFLLQPSNASGILANATLSDIMKDYFLSFAIELDPNKVSVSNASKPYWPLYSASNGTFLTILDVNQTSIQQAPDFDNGPRCRFFRENADIIRN